MILTFVSIGIGVGVGERLHFDREEQKKNCRGHGAEKLGRSRSF